ncbi:MAG: hypothetical protein Kow0068_07020 [Marinilabiliales bacterium]
MHSFVTDIIQDYRGYMWIATGGGLSRFDGIEFKNYTTKHGLCSQRLLCLQEDIAHNIWIGTIDGISVVTGDTIYSLHDKAFGKYVYSLCKASDGNIWAATDKGVSKVYIENRKINFKKFPFDFVDIDDEVIFQDRKLNVFLFETTKGELISGLSNNVYLIRDNNIYRVKHDAEIIINTACETDDGKIIFGTNDGVFQLVDNDIHPLKLKYLEGVEVLKISTLNSKLWLLGRYKNDNKVYLMSVNFADTSYFRKIGKENGLINDPTSIYIDHENNIWTASNGGLSVLKGEAFIVYNTQTGLTGDKIWGVFEDSHNRIWAGTIGQGLSIIARDTIYKYTTDNGLTDNYISSIFQDTDNSFYVGTSKKGLCTAKYNFVDDNYVFRQLYIGLNVGETRIDDIERDKNGVLWIASNKGLYYSEDNIIFKNFQLADNQYKPVFVQKLFISDDNTLYAGTKNDGLFIISSKGITHLYKNLNVSFICQDNDGNIWIGSQNKGIKKLFDKNSDWITERDGLASNVIFILHADDYNNLWIGSILGLDKFNAGEYNKSGKIFIRHYDTDDGLLDLEMNLNGGITDHAGNLWFASNKGLVRYDYKYDINNRIPPITNLLSVKLHSKKTDWTLYSDSLQTWTNIPVNPVLPYNQNHLTFEFVGISYKNPNEVLYTWKLEGFDKDWINPTPNRQAVYSNLPPGNYTFYLKSVNNDGVWSQQPVTFSFEILPPFWLTWWFRIVAVLFVLLTAYLLFYWRTRELQKRQRELTELVKTRTKEITIQKEIVEAKNREILDSISYANHLQKAILPAMEYVKQFFPQSFIYFKPKDVVSGDFYWFENFEDIYYFAVADCTGHGVPGAMVSVVCQNALNNAMNEFGERIPSKILDKTTELVIETFKKSGENIKDGMDIALCTYNPETKVLQYAGANNPLLIVRNNNMIILKPNKQPVGKQIARKNFDYQEIILEKNDMLYLFTDGYPDQFGGAKGRKFLMKNFRELLLEISSLPVEKQEIKLNTVFNEWKGNYEQVDDICVMGVKI